MTFHYKRNCDKCQHAMSLEDNECPNASCKQKYNPIVGGAASPDPNVEKNRKALLDRSILGQKKYGMTTANNPLTHKQWLQHALEEALDMANYLQAAISKLEQEEASNAKVNPKN